MRRVLAVPFLAFAVLCGGWRARPSLRATAPERASLVFTYGGDTLGRESFTRTDDSLIGDLLLGRKRFHYEARLSADGTVSRIEVRTSGPGVGVIGTRLTTATIGHDSTRIVDRLGDNVDTVRLTGQPVLLPIIDPSLGLLELIVGAARAQKVRTATIPVLSIEGLGSRAVVVTLVSPDTAWVGTPNGPKDAVRLALDDAGRIRGGMVGARRIEMLPTFTPFPPDLYAQQAAALPRAAPSDVSSADAIIRATYDANSVMVDQKRGADRFRSLYAPGARMINAVHDPAGAGMNARSVDEYIAGALSGPPRHGFSEREIARTSEAYGSIMQVFSTYESRRDSTDTHPTRGINSIQLFNDGHRWWILSVLWDAEPGNTPIPAAYLRSNPPR